VHALRAIVQRVKTLGFALLLALFAVATYLAFNTLRHVPAQRVNGMPAPDAVVQPERVAEHLAQAIRFPTISHQDPKDDDRSQYAALRQFLETTYPRVHAAFSRELINGDALLYRWPGSDSAAAPVLFLAHQDVVPIEPGTEAKWTHPPFAGVIADGFVWGRGALDDKGSLIGLFEAFESLLAQGFVPTRTIYLASGFDEEVGGSQGAKHIEAVLAARNVHLAWVLDEGGAVTQGVVPYVARPVASIAVAEKGYLSLELIAHAEGGHSSMPPVETAVGLLAAAITRLEQHPFAPRLTPILRQNLEILAPELPLLPRAIFANLWLTEPFVVRDLAARLETSPSVRTTIAPTMLQAGVKENVLPSSARAVVNFRLLRGDSIAQVIDYVRRVIDEPHVDVHKLERTLSEPAPFSSTTGPGYRLLSVALHETYPDAVITPGVMNGATDSRHFQPIADAVYRFVPRQLVKSDIKRMHGTDERAEIADLARSVSVYRKLIRAAASAAR
jgi:carboxypeptidase PM20D1